MKPSYKHGNNMGFGRGAGGLAAMWAGLGKNTPKPPPPPPPPRRITPPPPPPRRITPPPPPPRRSPPKPPRRSPPKPPPRRSPPKPPPRVSPRKKTPGESPYSIAFNAALQRTRTNKWRANAAAAYNAFNAAGLAHKPKQSWINSVAKSYANFEGLNARHKKQGMGGRGRYYSRSGNNNYVHHSHRNYNKLMVLLRRIELR